MVDGGQVSHAIIVGVASAGGDEGLLEVLDEVAHLDPQALRETVQTLVDALSDRIGTNIASSWTSETRWLMMDEVRFEQWALKETHGSTGDSAGHYIPTVYLSQVPWPAQPEPSVCSHCSLEQTFD